MWLFLQKYRTPCNATPYFILSTYKIYYNRQHQARENTDLSTQEACKIRTTNKCIFFQPVLALSLTSSNYNHQNSNSQCTDTHKRYSVAFPDLPSSQMPSLASPKMLPRRRAQWSPSLHIPPTSPSPPHFSPSSLAHSTQQPHSSRIWEVFVQGAGGQLDWSHGGQPQPNSGGKGNETTASGNAAITSSNRDQSWTRLRTAGCDIVHPALQYFNRCKCLRRKYLYALLYGSCRSSFSCKVLANSH